MEGVDALLLGRETCTRASPRPGGSRSGDPYTDRMNALPKHVATRTLDDLTWNSTRLEGDDAGAAVEALKTTDGGTLLKFGTASSTPPCSPWAGRRVHLWTFPVVAGRGDRLLDGLVGTTHLHLADVRRLRAASSCTC